MKSLEQILDMWSKDSVMDQTEPGKELLNIPKLHTKYLNELCEHRLAGKRAHFKYLEMRKIKWEYYNGKLSEEDLKARGWEPFRYTLKSDTNIYLESDADLIKLLEKKVYHDETVSVVELIMKEIHSRTYQLKDFISWEKFIGGN